MLEVIRNMSIESFGEEYITGRTFALIFKYCTKPKTWHDLCLIVVVSSDELHLVLFYTLKWCFDAIKCPGSWLWRVATSISYYIYIYIYISISLYNKKVQKPVYFKKKQSWTDILSHWAIKRKRLLNIRSLFSPFPVLKIQVTSAQFLRLSRFSLVMEHTC